MNDQTFTKYKTSSKIATIVMNKLIDIINNRTIVNVCELEKYGNNLIIEECNKVYKSESSKGIAFPTSISLNDCVGYYLYEKDLEQYNTIKCGDIVKIELGVHISNCVANLGRTIYVRERDVEVSEQYVNCIRLLEDLEKSIVKSIQDGETNDEVRIMIESKCTESNCFPVENTISYQHTDILTDAKYMILNYQKRYDINDNLLGEPNTCFEFLKDEVYTINLTVVPNDLEQYDETFHEYMTKHEPHIYRFNGLFYNLKLKMSRDFCSKVKSEWGTSAFDISKYKENGKDRMGMKECVENGILESYPVLYTKNKIPVFSRKFTIVVKENRSKLI